MGNENGSGNKGNVLPLFPPKKPPKPEEPLEVVSSSPTATYTEAMVSVAPMAVKGQNTPPGATPGLSVGDPPTPPAPPPPTGGAGNGGERKSSPLAMAILFSLATLVGLFLNSLNSQKKESVKMAEVAPSKQSVSKPFAEIPQVTIATSTPTREVHATPVIPMVNQPAPTATHSQGLALFSDNCPKESCVGVNRGDFQLLDYQQISFIESGGINFAVKLRQTLEICTNNAFFAQNVVLQDDFFKGSVVAVEETCGAWLQSKNMRQGEAITIRTEGNQLVRVRFNVK